MKDIVRSIILSANEAVQPDKKSSDLDTIRKYLAKNGYTELSNPLPSDIRKGDRIIRKRIGGFNYDAGRQFKSDHELEVVQSVAKSEDSSFLGAKPGGYDIVVKPYRYIKSDDGTYLEVFGAHTTMGMTTKLRDDMIAVYRKASKSASESVKSSDSDYELPVVLGTSTPYGDLTATISSVSSDEYDNELDLCISIAGEDYYSIRAKYSRETYKSLKWIAEDIINDCAKSILNGYTDYAEDGKHTYIDDSSEFDRYVGNVIYLRMNSGARSIVGSYRINQYWDRLRISRDK